MDFWCEVTSVPSPLVLGISRAATKATAIPVANSRPTSCRTNSHRTKSASCSAAATSASTAGSAKPSFNPIRG
jgi:hypothetical protein